MKRRHLWPIALLLLPLCACGGGGGDGDSGPVNDTLPSTTLSAAFVSDAESVEAGTVWLSEGNSSGSLVTVRVNVTDLEQIYAAGFDFEFDSSRVEFVNWSPGSLLESGNQTPIYQVQAQQGKLVVGVSRTGDVEGVDASGTQTLILLTFRARQAGTSAAVLDNATLLRPGSGTGPVPILDTIWTGGQFNAN